MAGAAPDVGAGSVLVVGVLAALAAVLVAAVVVASGVRQAHEAQSAADLAALAAAVPLVDGGEADCSAAARVARANGAELTGCRSDRDGSVAVQVTVTLPWPAGWPGLPGAVGARARAGLAAGRSPSVGGRRRGVA